MALFSSPMKLRLPLPEQALPGRDAEMPVPERHYVNGHPLKPPFPGHLQQLVVGMGCFWGAERKFWEAPGVYTTAVGYAGGYTPNPTYKEVCSGMTGHTEVVLVVFDPAQTSLDEMLRIFWENHDPTTWARQGGDIGTQYRSAIFATTPEQLAEAEASREKYQAALTEKGFGEISTQISLAADAGDGNFYLAEDYHQGYLYKNPSGYCNHGFCQVAYA